MKVLGKIIPSIVAVGLALASTYAAPQAKVQKVVTVVRAVGLAGHQAFAYANQFDNFKIPGFVTGPKDPLLARAAQFGGRNLVHAANASVVSGLDVVPYGQPGAARVAAANALRITHNSYLGHLTTPNPDLHRFTAGLTHGAMAPLEVIRQEMALHPVLRTELGPFLDAPPERRAFLVSSRMDDAQVQVLRAQLKNQGIESFNYLNCARALGTLCSDRLIGAMLAMSKHTMVVDSPDALVSPFAHAEINLSEKLNRMQLTLD